MTTPRYLGELQCPRCGTPVAETEAYWGCKQCTDRGLGVNLAAGYDLTGLAEVPVDAAQPGLFRYRELLPLRADTPAVSLGEGSTPLLHLQRYGAAHGLSRLLLKDESRNPTWSYKDRLAAVAVTKAREFGATRIVVSSSGNHGAAAAAYAAAAGIECVVLTIASVPDTMKVLMQSYSAHVYALTRPDDRWTLMRTLVAEHGWMPISGFLRPPVGSNPFGIDGYKTISYELAADLGDAPDVVAVPTAYGDGLVGIHRGFVELHEIGVTTKVPRMVAVDPLGAYAAAHRAGAITEVPDVDSVAFSIAVPTGTQQALDAVAASGGTALAGGDDEEILRRQRELARAEGLFLEPSSVVPLTALDDLVAAGVAGPDDAVVLIGTSSGLKDVGAAAGRLPAVPVIEPDIRSLEKYLALS